MTTKTTVTMDSNVFTMLDMLLLCDAQRLKEDEMLHYMHQVFGWSKTCTKYDVAEHIFNHIKA